MVSVFRFGHQKENATLESGTTFNTNILPISGKSGLRTHFWPLESGVLALGSEEKCFFSAGRRQKILFFSQSGPSISVLRVPEEKLAVHNFLG